MDSTSRFGWIALLLLLLSLSAATSAASGTIQIHVHPGGGTVCLDTVCRVSQDAVTGTGSTLFENVEAGRYHMLNVYGTPGYKPYLGQIYLDLTGTALTREITLDPLPLSAPETSTLRVFITPDGGRTCLDRMCEVSSGDRTGSWSVQYTDIAANTNHTLTIVNEGYQTYTTQVYFLPGQISSMSVTLLPLPPGSTPAPEPTPLPTTQSEPTRADLPGWAALLAIGICGTALVMKRHGPE